MEDLAPENNPIDTYDQTINEWKQRCLKIVFIYDYVVDKYRRRLAFFTIMSLILSSFASLSSLGNLGLSADNYPIIDLTLKIVNGVLTTLTMICLGLVRLMGWEKYIEECVGYEKSMENFLSLIISQQTLPSKDRRSEEFVLQQKDKFQITLNQAPDISHSDYLAALDNFQQSRARFKHDLIMA